MVRGLESPCQASQESNSAMIVSKLEDRLLLFISIHGPW